MLKLDPESPGFSRIFSVRDPRSLGSHGIIVTTGSRISKIPWEKENIRSKILQNLGSWILEIQDLGSFLGSWHMSGTDPSLSLTCKGSDWKWLQFFFNSTCKSDYKPYAACPKKNYWIWWPFVTLLWPDLDPDPYLVWNLCSEGIFNSPLRLLWLSF